MAIIDESGKLMWRTPQATRQMTILLWRHEHYVLLHGKPFARMDKHALSGASQPTTTGTKTVYMVHLERDKLGSCYEPSNLELRIWSMTPNMRSQKWNGQFAWRTSTIKLKHA